MKTMADLVSTRTVLQPVHLRRLELALESRYPGLKILDDPRLLQNELEYKRKLSQRAQTELTKEAFDRWIKDGAHTEALKAMQTLASATNLLFLRQPQEGDANIVHWEGLPTGPYVLAVRELLHGEKPIKDRVADYLAAVRAMGVPEKKIRWEWTTFFLWLLHADEALFVRRSYFTPLCDTLGITGFDSGKVDAQTYAWILDMAQEVKEHFAARGARDLIDVQTILWEAGRFHTWAYRPSGRTAVPNEENILPFQWGETGDLRNYGTKADLEAFGAEFKEKHPADKVGWSKQGLAQPWNFYKEVNEGDLVAVLEDNNTCIAIARIDGDYEFRQELPDPHARKVTWISTARRRLDQPLAGFAFFELDAAKWAVIERAKEGAAVVAQPVAKAAATTRWWRVAPGEGAEDWENCRTDGDIGLGWGELGDITGLSAQQFQSKLREVIATEGEDKNQANHGGNYVWKFAHDVKEGDTIVANRGKRQVLAIGRVSSPYYFQEGSPYPHRRTVAWQFFDPPLEGTFNWGINSFQALDASFVRQIEDLRGAQPTGEEPVTLAEVSKKTYIPVEELERWLAQLKHKRQAVLYGPPGTGKTFIAKLLARHLTAGRGGEVEMVQFHPSYGYEDFIEGLRPRLDSGVVQFEMVEGRFKRFCERAAANPGSPHVLIIDEMNRANLPRVFGELMYLLEYRNDTVQLAQSGQRFGIPENVLLIGTMNTADRSLALIDHALRRRFAFIRLDPHYETLDGALEGSVLKAAELRTLLGEINEAIGDRNLHIGISYFMRPGLKDDPKAAMPLIWRMEIEPMLDEVFFDKPDQADTFRWDKVQSRLLPEAE